MLRAKAGFSTLSVIFSSIFFGLIELELATAGKAYYGKLIGPLSSYEHGLGGTVYAVDSRTLHIRDFKYDGEGPAGYFYVSRSKNPGENGIKIPDERGSLEPLKRYKKRHITLTLPEGHSLQDINIFYVWCDDYSVNFGDVKIPRNFDYPKPQKIGKLSGVHGVSSDNVVIVDSQTLLLPNFSYDGEAPDAKFWTGPGRNPTAQGILVPDENGKETPLRRYDRKTLVLTLPGDLTVSDIGHFGVWCEAFTVDFGHVQIPSVLNTPPSLRMLGVSPQSKLNCEILYDDLAFEVRWAVAGDSIVVQLVSKLEKGEYMSFGLSGKRDSNVMIGGDVVVAWMDQDTMNGYVHDYYLDDKSQCAGGRGSCPDKNIQENSDNVRLLNAALVNGYSIITYQRPIKAFDRLDLPIFTNASQAVIWAIGPLNSLQEVSYHRLTSKSNTLIDFGRTPKWNCPIPESDSHISIDSEVEEESTSPLPQTVSTSTAAIATKRERGEATPAPAKTDVQPWEIPPIPCNEPDDGVFYAQMGPTGGKRGYPAITGHVGWGTAWYINGLLIPEINVVRGRTYTFLVEGGMDPEIPARYHPFYITDDPIGGYMHKSPEEKKKVKIFAGVNRDKNGELTPAGTGRLCNWTPDQDQPIADEFLSFGAYQRTLTLVCENGEPGLVQWTPTEDTPDTVYYQCFTHRYLGWKINVLDSCDKTHSAAASEPVPSKIEPQSNSLPRNQTENRIREDAEIAPMDSYPTMSDSLVPPPPAIKHRSKPTRRIPISRPQPAKGIIKMAYSANQPEFVQKPRQQPLNFRGNNQNRLINRPHLPIRSDNSDQGTKSALKRYARPELVPTGPVSYNPPKYEMPPFNVPVKKTNFPNRMHHPAIINKKPIVTNHHRVNDLEKTGFDPSSIVIEGGFKPVLTTNNQYNDNTTVESATSSTTNQPIAEDRIDEAAVESNHKPEDNANEPKNHANDLFQGQQPIQFEPVFVPSPLIEEENTIKKKKKPVISPQQPRRLTKPNKISPAPANIIIVRPKGKSENIFNVPVQYGYHLDGSPVSAANDIITGKIRKDEASIPVNKIGKPQFLVTAR